MQVEGGVTSLTREPGRRALRGGNAMTEEEWLVCPDPLRMLRHLGAEPNARKTLLLTAVCLRRIWDVLPQEGRSWIELAEGVAEGQVNREELPDEACEYAIQVRRGTAGWPDNGVTYAVQSIFHAYWQSAENA
jgi:hypothetical protein